MRKEEAGTDHGFAAVRGLGIRYGATLERGSYTLFIRTDRGEYSAAKGVTRSETEAERLLEILRDNAVFPCHLHEILEDLLAEGRFE